MKPGMKIELAITSDVVCVWCYIGLHRLEQALAQRPDVDAIVTFQPYELSPELSAEGMDRMAFIAQKFGLDRWPAMEARLVATAKADNLPLNYSRMTRRPNSLLAHMLVARGQERGLGRDLHRAITAGYFAGGRDIGRPEVLAEIAVGCGMAGQDALAALADVGLGQAVALRGQQARQSGIEGVPLFVINGQYAISGAQSTVDWLKIFDDLGAP